MDTVLGLLGVLVFIACIVSLAAAMTWGVVKLLPAREKKPTEEAS